MMIIYKYQLEAETVIPATAKILSVGTQDGKPVLWALLDDNDTSGMYRKVLGFPTGVTIDETLLESYEYVGTASGIDNHYVWHFFAGKT